jgi:hypothetical protein
MSYLGRTELKSSDIRLKAAYAISGSSTNTVVLTWTAPSEESLIFTVNGVVQQTDAFSIAGTPTTITLASGNFADGATVEVVGINDIGTAIVPADGSVTRPKLATTGTPDGTKVLQDNMAWVDATAGAVDGVFWENSQTISSDYTITASKNAMTAGDITVNTGVTVTVPAGARWAIV